MPCGPTLTSHGVTGSQTVMPLNTSSPNPANFDTVSKSQYLAEFDDILTSFACSLAISRKNPSGNVPVTPQSSGHKTYASYGVRAFVWLPVVAITGAAASMANLCRDRRRFLHLVGSSDLLSLLLQLAAVVEIVGTAAVRAASSYLSRSAWANSADSWADFDQFAGRNRPCSKSNRACI